MSNRSRSTASMGFTLVEILIALAIFATVSTTIYTRTGDTIFQLQSLERRTIAHWLAKDAATLARLEVQSTGDFPQQSLQSTTLISAGREWRIESEIMGTGNEWVKRMDVRVYLMENGKEIGPIENYFSFLGKY